MSFIEEWIQEGEARGGRQLLLRQLRECFGELPASAVEQIESMLLAECEELAVRVLNARSLVDLGLSGTGDTRSEPAPEAEQK